MDGMGWARDDSWTASNHWGRRTGGVMAVERDKLTTGQSTTLHHLYKRKHGNSPPPLLLSLPLITGNPLSVNTPTHFISPCITRSFQLF